MNKKIKKSPEDDFYQIKDTNPNKISEDKMFRIHNTREILLKRKIYILLINMGFSTKYKGFSYLLDSIKYIIERGCIEASLSKEIYESVACSYGTLAKTVEINIRNLIKCAWENGKISNSNFKCRPSNGAFIFYVVEHIFAE